MIPQDKIAQFKEVADLMPDDPVVRLGLATAYLEAGQAEDAVREFKETVRLKADYTAAHRGLGRALEKAGRPEEAKAAYRNGIEVGRVTGDLQTVKEMEVFLRRLAGLLLILMLVPGLAVAQMYQWEDEQGTVHVTNELQSIPEPFRSGARFVPASPMAPPALAPSAGITRIPFTPGSPILVTATINGTGPVTLILDTGADHTMVSPLALWRLGISTVNAPRAEIKGVTGTGQGDVVQVASVGVGEAKAGPLLIISHDANLKEADGLLGRDFLERFTVIIDAKEGVVTLTPR